MGHTQTWAFIRTKNDGEGAGTPTSRNAIFKGQTEAEDPAESEKAPICRRALLSPQQTWAAKCQLGSPISCDRREKEVKDRSEV